jgi:hypothetical protein
MPFPREIDERRVMRGQEIAKLGQIKRLDDTSYEVNSQSGHGLYTVVRGSRDWRCSCPDHCTEKSSVSTFGPFNSLKQFGKKSAKV